MAADDDEILDGLIHRADLDGLVRLVDDCCATGDWERLRRLRDRARHAVGTGRQLWPAATLAEYRLALLAPAPWAAGVLDEGSGRFTIGPLTEVVAQHHTWHELAPLLEPGPRAAFVAHERVLRGEAVEAESVAALPDVLELPYRIAGWEPAYQLAAYHDAGAEFPSPATPPLLDDVALPVGEPTGLDDGSVELAVRQLVEPWTTSSNGRVDVAAVEGDAAAALRRARADERPLGPAGSGRRHRLARLGGRQRRRLRPAAGGGGRPVRRPLAARRPRRRPRRLAVADGRARRAGRRAALVLVGRPRTGHRLAAPARRRVAGRRRRLGGQRPGCGLTR